MSLVLPEELTLNEKFRDHQREHESKQQLLRYFPLITTNMKQLGDQQSQQRFIIWGVFKISGQTYIAIHVILVEIFRSCPEWSTDRELKKISFYTRYNNMHRHSPNTTLCDAQSLYGGPQIEPLNLVTHFLILFLVSVQGRPDQENQLQRNREGGLRRALAADRREV